MRVFAVWLLCLLLVACQPRAQTLAPTLEAAPEASLALPDVALSASEEAEVDGMVLALPESWTGDLQGMRERRLVRILVPYSKTFYTVDRGQQDGISYSYGKAFEDWLNRHQPFPRRSLSWEVMFIPVARDQLLPKLLAGEGDIAAGGLTITTQRLEQVDFASPFVSAIREALVTGPASQPISRLEEMSGYEVTVRRSSSYHEHLLALNAQFKARGMAPVRIMLADENLESEDLLEMLNAGLLNAVVVDRYIAQAWQPLYQRLRIHDAFYIHQDAEFAWAIRPDSPQLKEALDSFARSHRLGTPFGNALRVRYVTQSGKRLRNPTREAEMRKFESLVALFQKHAMTYDFDYLMLMAQGFQESRLNQAARSPMGAVGVMQLLPSTAADIGIQGVDKSADRNIEAGSKYMRLLAARYLDDPQLTDMNRTLLSFAGYNAGPGNLRKFRRLAEKSGLDPNVWFGNVEHAAARVVGRETVDYVANIYKYYLAYKLVEFRHQQRQQGKSQLRERQATR